MLKGPFLDKNFIGAIDSWDEAKIVLLGMPFDGTCTNRPGTRFAPQQIRLESVGIEEYSCVFDKNLSYVAFFDAGDLELPFGNAARTLNIIEANVSQIYNENKKLLGIGGEHLVTLASIRAINKILGDIAVVQFDAHTDLRSEYLGESLTHSGVMKQIAEIIGWENICQAGIRSGEKEEFDLMKKYKTQLFYPDELKKLKNKKVFITIDLDVLDPSLMSGVGTPEAGGFTYLELLNWLKEFKKIGLEIVGADIVELAPDIDITKTSTATACKLIREVLMLF